MKEAIENALRTLAAPGHRIADAFDHVPNVPGLYAVHADGEVWRELQLEPRSGSFPLYVGKAEDSLASRDLRTHFSAGRTGSSTLRRSLAALLRRSLELCATPRNPAKPGHFANYTLTSEGEARLTEWMRDHLTLSVWAKPDLVRLRDIEVAVLRAWQPPLNLTDVAEPSRYLKTQRAAMAAEAREWAASQYPR
ncbi:GIY-YIG nuclease family protein [Naasia sp. SYSU D00057]|uniref:GIY-YIG nuclease family protein n=1 Tax=Naasia sp. SYSU D00057 TaxID=2817380 RepID=UPI001B308105|nr:hypothetical protein [Naasia sp. SYSU D00057]